MFRLSNTVKIISLLCLVVLAAGCGSKPEEDTTVPSKATSGAGVKGADAGTSNAAASASEVLPPPPNAVKK